jgi:hypothetical protein
MASWSDDELSTLTFGDVRNDDRFKMVVSCMSDNPGASIPQVFNNAADAKATYRLLSNEAVKPEAVYDALHESTAARMSAEESAMVLVVHDTTSLDYSTHPATSGLGPLGGGDGSDGHGLFVHTSMAVTCDGVPLGVLHQQTWARDPNNVGTRHFRHDRPIEDKESYRWLVGIELINGTIPDMMWMLHVADREADIFELLWLPRPEYAHLLIRVCHDRCVVEEAAHLMAAVAAAPQMGVYDVIVRQFPEHKPRAVRLAVRCAPVTIKPPQRSLRHNPALTPVAMTAIWVQEVDAPEGKEPIEWLLLTDLPVEDLATAREFVHYYTCRWLIERFHYVLKSGCKLEDSQLRTLERLQRLLALYCVIAWRLLWMTYAARERGDQPATVAFDDSEWRLLYRWAKGRHAPVGAEPPSLREAVLWLAKLGGFLARKCDGEPGVKVLWRGLTKLQYMLIGAALAT